MAKVLVTYYSRTGNVKSMAESVGEGVDGAGAQLTLKPLDEVTIQDLLEHQGIVVGSPTYYGLPAYQIKKLFDESVKIHTKLGGKIGGAFTSSALPGGGNETTILAILQMMLVHGMIITGEAASDHYGPVSIGEPNKKVLKSCKNYGKKIGKLTIKLFG
ncbi:MAG: flavodoxin domain-containing protein [Chloroflexi bacterium]|nr:flavodoxin domain-containing protein [Chloroflexota bacterium]